MDANQDIRTASNIGNHESLTMPVNLNKSFTGISATYYDPCLCLMSSSDCNSYYCSKGGSQVKEYKEQQDVYRRRYGQQPQYFHQGDHYTSTKTTSTGSFQHAIGTFCRHVWVKRKQTYLTRCLEILQLSRLQRFLKRGSRPTFLTRLLIEI